MQRLAFSCTGAFFAQSRPGKIDVSADRSILRLSAATLSRRLPDPQDADGKTEEVMVRLGGAASPTYVGIFRGLQAHFLRHGIELDWVIYSDYDALVEAFARREIDLAWNALLAYVKSKASPSGSLSSGGGSRTYQ